jgi:hypothetical protein
MYLSSTYGNGIETKYTGEDTEQEATTRGKDYSPEGPHSEGGAGSLPDDDDRYLP